jgi:hypothetical protein
MQQVKKVCLYCHRSFFIQHNPSQKCCSQPECQKKRKNQWRQHKRRQDRDYRDNQRKADRRWRQKNPVYWQHYRATHQDYVAKNRDQQRARDQRRSFNDMSATRRHLAKSDASPKNSPVPSGTYELIPVPAPGLAKSDALRVKITLISYDYVMEPLLQRDHLIANGERAV